MGAKSECLAVTFFLFLKYQQHYIRFFISLVNHSKNLKGIGRTPVIVDIRSDK